MKTRVGRFQVTRRCRRKDECQVDKYSEAAIEALTPYFDTTMGLHEGNAIVQGVAAVIRSRVEAERERICKLLMDGIPELQKRESYGGPELGPLMVELVEKINVAPKEG